MRKVILGEACLGLIIYFRLCLICILDVDSNLIKYHFDTEPTPH